MALQKTGSGQVITEDGDTVRKTAAARPLTRQDVRDIEDEDTPED
jgi:hypothetical protein